MTGQALKVEIKLNFPIFFGFTLLAHLLIFFLVHGPITQELEKSLSRATKSPLKILTLGEKNAKSKNSVYFRPEPQALPSLAKQARPKELNFKDLSVAQPQMRPSPKITQNSSRPGQQPQKRESALSGLRYGADEFKKMARESMLQGGADILTSERIALNFEVPEGKNKDELNESQLRLYGFLRRGAIKYVTSLSSELKQFEMRNPHLQFPLTDAKQVLTGRLVYDKEGNLKQIKMVRWTNIDKLQGFFENVLKRLDTLQNPPKELWAEEGEFTVFVTLQING